MAQSALESAVKASDTTAGSSGSQPFDPLAGAYPQVMWMFNVYDVPCAIEVAPDGRVQPSSAAKPRTTAVIEAAGVNAVFESVRALPGSRLVSVPAIVAAMGQEATVESGTSDKAGQVLANRSIAVLASEDGATLRTRLEVSARSGSFSVSSTAGREAIPAGGALVMVVPAPREGEPCTLVMARPEILRSVKDYPFQTSTALP